ncbi:MAG: hypothetical protein GY782_00165, partial [Gammaproteobacteria bacterium]|nr:hypothetical protein [Gammaproteobacteria bacterium]
MLAVGLALANGLAALCGVMTAQINGYADINMGIGQALTAIGSVVIGLKLVHTLFYRRPQFNALVDVFACLLGSYTSRGLKLRGIFNTYYKLKLDKILLYEIIMFMNVSRVIIYKENRMS